MSETVEGVLRVAADAYYRQLWSETRPTERDGLLNDRNIEAGTLRWMATKTKSKVLTTLLAGHVNTPPDVLAHLVALDPRGRAARRAYRNPHIPYHCLPEDDKPHRLVHPDCPPTILAGAYGGRGGQRNIVAHPNLDEQLRQQIFESAKDSSYLLENPHTPHAQALAIIERHPRQTWLRWVWSQHLHADPDWLHTLAQDQLNNPDQGTIARIADNPVTRSDTLMLLYTHRHARWTRCLANPHASVELHHLFLDSIQGREQSEIFRYYNQYLSAQAAHPHADFTVLARHDPAWHQARTPSNWWAFIRTHATTTVQARVLLSLGPTFNGTLAELLGVSAALSGTC